MRAYYGAGLVVAAMVHLSGCAGDPLHVTGRAGGTGSDSYAAVMHIAAASRQAGDLNAAVGLYRKANDLAPNYPEPRVALGGVLLDLGQTDDAIAAYQQALKVSTDSPEALRGLANAYLAADRPDLAQRPLKTALSHDPNNPQLLDGMGVACDLGGDHKTAQIYYRNGLAAAPQNGNLANNFALSLALSGDYAQAITVLQPVADGRQATPKQRQTLSLIYGLAGNRDAAARYAKMDLDDATVAHNLAYFETLRGMDAEARARAIAAATWKAPHKATVTDVLN